MVATPGVSIPNSCSDVGAGSYQILIKNNAGAVVALGTWGYGAFKRQDDSTGIVEIDCDFTYTATLLPSPAYTFTIVSKGNSADVKATRLIDLATLKASGAPSLGVVESFCPECG
jgi:hypothetical protein